MPSPRKQERQACGAMAFGNAVTRKRILRSAAEAFAQLGYHRATIRFIAAGAGVDPALPFRYFSDKAGLFDAVLRAELEQAVGADSDSEQLCRLVLAALWAPVDPPRRDEVARALARLAPLALQGVTPRRRMDAALQQLGDVATAMLRP